jgi:hypothetical protein
LSYGNAQTADEDNETLAYKTFGCYLSCDTGRCLDRPSYDDVKSEERRDLQLEDVKAPFQLPEKPKVAALRLFKVGHYALTRKIPERIGNVSRRRGLGTGSRK